MRVLEEEPLGDGGGGREGAAEGAVAAGAEAREEGGGGGPGAVGGGFGGVLGGPRDAFLVEADAVVWWLVGWQGGSIDRHESIALERQPHTQTEA